MAEKIRWSLLSLLSLILACLGTPTACSQVLDSFENSERSWQLRQWTASIDWPVLQQGISQQQHQSGNASYRFKFRCGPGEQIMASYDLSPSFVIPELEPTVYVRCARTGVQLYARVVFPNTDSPSGNGPMTTLIEGDICQQIDRWTKLGFQTDDGTTLYQKMKSQLPLLRRKYGSQVSEKDAYIDAVILNLYGGPGDQEVWIDTLAVEGRVSAERIQQASFLAAEESVPNVVQVAGMQVEQSRPSRVRTDGTVVLIDDRPFVIRAIEYNGEAMSALKEMGFNTLWMANSPTVSQLQRAKDHRLWVIAPPPVDDGLRLINFQYDPVLAWLVGDRVNWADHAVVKQRIAKIRQIDIRQGRPVLVTAQTGLSDYSRTADLLCVGQKIIGTSFPLHLYSKWLQQRAQLAQAYVPMLAEIDTDFSPQLIQQSAAFSGTNAPIAIQPAQLRGLVFQAIAGGARGFVFRSQSRLDDTSPATLQRQLAIRWVNRQLEQLAPWTAGAVVTGQVDQVDPSIQVHALKTSRSRLLLVQQVNGRESFTAGSSREGVIAIQDAGSGVSDQPYRLTPTGLSPATHQRLGNQLTIQIENASDWEAIVLTQDPLVIRYVEQSSNQGQSWSFNQLHLEQAEYSTEWASRLQTAMVQAGRDRPEIQSALTRILSARQSINPTLASSDPLALWSQSNILQREVARLNDSLVTEAQAMLSWPTASPLDLHPILIPLHWQSISRMSQVQWSGNGLPGGDFEDIGQTTSSGWQHHSNSGSSIQSFAQLNEAALVDGRKGLVLSAQPAAGIPAAVVENTPVWIVSAPVQIPANHLVRIAGYVRIDQPITGSLDGFLIKDSLGGLDLSQRISATRGWQPFVVYRATNDPHDLKITFALSGYGQVMLDEITVQMAPMPTGNTGSAFEVLSPTSGSQPGASVPGSALPNSALPNSSLPATAAGPATSQPGFGR